MYYLEHCRVMQKDGSVLYLTEGKKDSLYFNIPIAKYHCNAFRHRHFHHSGRRASWFLWRWRHTSIHGQRNRMANTSERIPANGRICKFY